MGGVFTHFQRNVNRLNWIELLERLPLRYIQLHDIHVHFDFFAPLKDLSGDYVLVSPTELRFRALNTPQIQFFRGSPVFMVDEMIVKNTNDPTIFRSIIFNCRTFQGRATLKVRLSEDLGGFHTISIEPSEDFEIDIEQPVKRRRVFTESKEPVEVRELKSDIQLLDGLYDFSFGVYSKLDQPQTRAVQIVSNKAGDVLNSMRLIYGVDENSEPLQDLIITQVRMTEEDRRLVAAGLAEHWDTAKEGIPNEVASYLARTTTRKKRQRRKRTPALSLKLR